jgi:hypothetical protein
MKRNISGRLFFAITFCIARIPLTKELNRADCGYQIYKPEREISHLLYMDDWKLQGRNEDDLENKINIVKVISTDINVKFGKEKCARICLKKVGSKAK